MGMVLLCSFSRALCPWKALEHFCMCMCCDYVGQMLHMTLPSSTPKNWECTLHFTVLRIYSDWFSFFCAETSRCFFFSHKGDEIILISVYNMYSTGNDFTGVLTLPNTSSTLIPRTKCKTNLFQPPLPNNFRHFFLFWKHGNSKKWILCLSNDLYKGSAILNFRL